MFRLFGRDCPRPRPTPQRSRQRSSDRRFGGEGVFALAVDGENGVVPWRDQQSRPSRPNQNSRRHSHTPAAAAHTSPRALSSASRFRRAARAWTRFSGEHCLNLPPQEMTRLIVEVETPNCSASARGVMRRLHAFTALCHSRIIMTCSSVNARGRPMVLVMSASRVKQAEFACACGRVTPQRSSPGRAQRAREHAPSGARAGPGLRERRDRLAGAGRVPKSLPPGHSRRLQELRDRADPRSGPALSGKHRLG